MSEYLSPSLSEDFFVGIKGKRISEYISNRRMFLAAMPYMVHR